MRHLISDHFFELDLNFRLQIIREFSECSTHLSRFILAPFFPFASCDLVLNAANLQTGTVKYDMKQIDFKELVKKVSEEMNCFYLDLNEFVTPSPVDGLHYSKESHKIRLNDFLNKGASRVVGSSFCFLKNML